MQFASQCPVRAAVPRSDMILARFLEMPARDGILRGVDFLVCRGDIRGAIRRKQEGLPAVWRQPFVTHATG
jgi:hypothetical protein